MLRLSIAALSCMLLLANVWADDKEEAAKKEQEKFQGEWKMVLGGQEATVKFTGAEYEFIFGDMKEKGKMKFNPTVKPHEVDVEITEGDDSGKKQVGIYEINGDKVKLCFAKAGETKRPDKFENSGDGSSVLLELEKVKK